MSGDSKTIAILGCGWLGMPLSEKLISNGYTVRGSTTTSGKLSMLKEKGIEPFLIRVQKDGVWGDLKSFISGAEVLIIDFPPGIRSQPAEDYIDSIKQLAEGIRSSSLKRILFVSSISVYEDSEEFPVYTEQNIPNASAARGRGLIAAENVLCSEPGFETSILRLGGLIGQGRHPVNQLSGKGGIANPEAPVNLIHQKDCIGIIEKLLQQERFGQVYNAVYPEHPGKEQYYSQKAKELKLPFPHFSSAPSKGKIVDPTKVQKELRYQFTAPI